MFPNGRNEFRFSVQPGQRETKENERDKRRTIREALSYFFFSDIE